MMPDKRGVILFAHGSPDPAWKKSTVALQLRLEQALPGVMVASAFLKDTQPSIFEAACDMRSAGVENVTVIPVFLAAGSHYVNDFPVIGKKLEEENPGVEFTWTDVIGRWDEVTGALAAAIAGRVDRAENP